MKIWKILMMLALPYFILGCCRYIDQVELPYSICTLDVKNIDFSGKEIVPSQSDTLLKQAFGLQFNFGLIDNGACKSPTSIFTSAYASKCDNTEKFKYTPRSNIRSIAIITMNDFDATHLAGDTITEYFYEYDGKSYNALNKNASIIKEHLTIESVQDVTLNFLLMTPPAQSSLFYFQVEIELMDNRKLLAISKQTYLQ